MFRKNCWLTVLKATKGTFLKQSLFSLQLPSLQEILNKVSLSSKGTSVLQGSVIFPDAVNLFFYVTGQDSPALNINVDHFLYFEI